MEVDFSPVRPTCDYCESPWDFNANRCGNCGALPVEQKTQKHRSPRVLEPTVIWK